MKKLVILLSLIASLVIVTKVFAICEGMTKLNTILNNDHLYRYLAIKGYIEKQDYGFGHEDWIYPPVLFSDYQYGSDNKLEILIYFKSNPINTSFKNKNDGKVVAAEDICRVFSNLSRKHVTWEYSNNYLRLIFKNANIPDIYGNTIFTWENGKIEYFPKFFDDSL